MIKNLFNAWKKEFAARRYIWRGNATIRELLAHSYGEWPLKGLNDDYAEDMASYLDQRVKITPISAWWWRSVTAPQPSAGKRMKAILYATGMAFSSSGIAIGGDQREIVLNGYKRTWFYFCGKMITRRLIAHELRHVLQRDPVFPSRRKDLFGRHFGKRHVPYATEIIETLLENGMKSEGSVKRQMLKLSQALSKWMKQTTGLELQRVYFRQGVEIQARMEEFISEGYRRWKRMPADRLELYAALWNAGIRPPENIARKLLAKKEFTEALSLFASVKAPYGLVTAIAQLPGERTKELFWNVALPALYGDMLETFGDREGRARMRDLDDNKNNHWGDGKFLFGTNPMVVPLLLGKLYDRCHEGEEGVTLEEDIARATRKINAGYLAGFLSGFYGRIQKQAERSGQPDIPPGDARFLLACLENQQVSNTIAEHDSALRTWLEKRRNATPEAPPLSPSRAHTADIRTEKPKDGLTKG